MIYVDADACPVKPEVIKVATRHQLKVVFVANSWMRLPEEWIAELVVVDNQLDAADDWIVERIQENDVLVSTDIPLIDRALKKKAKVIDPKGKIYSDDNIGSILATRDLLTGLRDAGEITGGPPPFRKEDRSFFLQNLEKTLQEIKRNSL